VDGCLAVQIVLGSHGQSGGSRSCGYGDACLELRADLLVDSGAKVLSVVDGSVHDEVARVVADSEVALGEIRAAGVKSHLISGRDGTVTNSDACVDYGFSSEIEISIDNCLVELEVCLEFTRLSSSDGLKSTVKGQLQTFN